MNTSAACALRLMRSASLTKSNGWLVGSRTMAAGKGSTTTTIKSGGSAAGSSGGAVNVDGKNLDPPAFVYKQVDKSALGPGASKQSEYKNPEYFSYHNMSYTDFELAMAKLRVPQPSNKKKL